jgi:serine-protein kinase ATM
MYSLVHPLIKSYRREDVRLVLSSRETLFSTLSNNDSLREAMHLGLKDVRDIEVETLLSSCSIARKHNSLQDSLATATYLSDLSPLCSQIGLDIEASAQNEVADALWDQGEHVTSIRMLKRLTELPRSKHESSQLHRSRLLAKLVSWR